MDGKWNFVSQRMEGHGLMLDLQCCSCGITKTWKSSNAYPDGSLEVNRDVARAWMTTGGERALLQVYWGFEMWKLQSK
jgi:hypothetical protein